MPIASVRNGRYDSSPLRIHSNILLSQDLQLLTSASPPVEFLQVRCYRLITAGTVEERIVAAAQNKRVMNALVMRDAPGAGGVGEGGEGGAEGGAGAGGGPARAVPMAELLRAVMDGCRCIENGGVDGGSVGALNSEEIDAILDRAEADSDPVANATHSGPAADSSLLQSSSTLANASRVASDQTPGQAELEKAAPDGGSALQPDEAEPDEADLNGTQAALARVFRSLPAIREFEGRDYSGRRKRDSESAAAFRGLADIWEKQHLPPRNAEPAAPAGKLDHPQISVEKGRQALLHRRWCQKCQRSVGAMLFCSR